MKAGANAGRAPLDVLPVEQAAAEKFTRPRHQCHDSIIYELHVKGFTARENSGVTKENRGKFLGLVEKIPYLKEHGVTVVELLPVHQLDPQEGNYWGDMALNFFAPHQGYAVREAVAEFRAMVRAFHAAGIEVWLNVVYNPPAKATSPGRPIPGAGSTTAVTTCLGPDGQYAVAVTWQHAALCA
jgi:glycogen operon protein